MLPWLRPPDPDDTETGLRIPSAGNVHGKDKYPEYLSPWTTFDVAVVRTRTLANGGGRWGHGASHGPLKSSGSHTHIRARARALQTALDT